MHRISKAIKNDFESHISKLKEIRDQHKQEIFDLLGFNDLQYGNMVHDFGLAYLEHQVINDGWVREISGSRMFWKWWVNHWDTRNGHFLLGYKKSLGDLNRQELVIAFEVWHDPLDLDVYISSEAYKLMIDKVLNEKKVNV